MVGVNELVPRPEGAPALCHFRRLTGVECPTCGSTRAVRAMMRGDLLGALTANPLMTTFVVGIVLWFVVRIVAQRRVVVEASRAWHRWTVVLLLGALLVNWGWVIWRG